jgi:hypothetical protein
MNVNSTPWHWSIHRIGLIWQSRGCDIRSALFQANGNQQKLCCSYSKQLLYRKIPHVEKAKRYYAALKR